MLDLLQVRCWQDGSQLQSRSPRLAPGWGLLWDGDIPEQSEFMATDPSTRQPSPQVTQAF